MAGIPIFFFNLATMYTLLSPLPREASLDMEEE
jgi:hypothetical protein